MKHGGILTKVIGGAAAAAVTAPVAAGICAGVILANTGIENAEFVGYSGEQGLTVTELYNETNTYAYKGNPFEKTSNYEPETYKYRKYNEYYSITGESRQPLANKVSTASPQMTVLTHGLTGGAFHWSNKTIKEKDDNVTKFAYSDSSLITQLSASVTGGAQVYWAKMQSHTAFKLYDLNNPNNIENGVCREKVTVSKLDSVSSHIIVVFEANKDAKQGYNNEVYEEFNYVVSKLVYDVKCLNDGLLPKINLIGHSRGGITNLQYALDHPDLVEGMFGLGTPYLGSTTAKTEIGKQIQDSKGREDIVDDNIYLGYYNRWTNNRSIYQNIRAHALGGYSTMQYLVRAILKAKDLLNSQGIKPIYLRLLNVCINILPDWATSFIGSLANQSELVNTILDDLDSLGEDPIERLRLSEQGSSNRIYENDLLVDLRSQVGVKNQRDYNFNLYAKCFTKDEGKLSSPTMPAVVHNLEAQDPNFIGYILRNIDLGNANGPVYRVTDDNTVTLLGYRGAILSERFEVPREINGYPVVEIEDEAFTNVFS